MLDSLVDVLGSQWWSYPLIGLLCLFDSVLPVLPSETAMITGGILAASTPTLLWLVIVAGAVGSWLGDNLAYTIGASAEGWARRFIVRNDKGRQRLEWAERMLHQHGGTLVIVARFIPGGRTVATVACGILRFPRRRFMMYDAVGAIAWATINALIGYVGGSAFADRTWLAFVLSFGVSLVIAGAIQLGRSLYGRVHGGGDAGEAGSEPS